MVPGWPEIACDRRPASSQHLANSSGVSLPSDPCGRSWLYSFRQLSIFSLDEENEDGATYEVADPASPDPEAESVKREDRDHLHVLLKNLDETDRAAVILRYWYDYSEIEIADSLKLTVSAVKSRLHRSRRALAGMWQENQPRTRTERRTHESPAF